jgi:hypothetical protein
MLTSAIAYTSNLNADAAARELSEELEKGMAGARPDALILFASPQLDQAALLTALSASSAPKLLVGASSAGEFTSDTRGTGLACALALRSDELLFTAAVGRGVGKDRARVAQEIAKSFRGSTVTTHPYRSALVLTDALAGYADDLVDQLTLATSGQYQFFGGGAGDDAQFRRTHVFYGTEAITDAAVALEILSKKPLGIGVGHGWQPAGPAMRVTEVKGATLISLNGEPAADAFERHAQTTGQPFDRKDPLPFFLHNIIGIDTGSGHRLRVPLAIDERGAVTCASEVPLHAKVHIMKTDASSAVDAATRATQSAVASLQGGIPKTALFFDCVATRLRIGENFGLELDALARELGPSANYVGCNTHGQIARAEGQFGGFHNCTAVVCVLPE